VDGTTRWRGSQNLTWRKGKWSVGGSAYYIGKLEDSALTTNAATYQALGTLSYIGKTYESGAYVYRYIVHDTVTFNTFVSSRFAGERNAWTRDTTVRLGVVNFTDKKPPLTGGGASSIFNPLGYRRHEVDRRFA
jgi:hypothetical protein